MILADPKTREEWLQARRSGIGGSDAGSIVGRNPWKSNVALWAEKTGKITPEDIGDKPAVKFGKYAEAPVREIFLLMHPELSCEYHEFRMYANDKHPFIYATLDGELTAQDGRRGIYEGKTTTIQRASQWNEWDNRIPDHYYVQILHQMLACDWAQFVILNAFIRYGSDGETARMQSYQINREDPQVKADMGVLLEAEIMFWEFVQSRTEPALLLPEV